VFPTRLALTGDAGGVGDNAKTRRAAGNISRDRDIHLTGLSQVSGSPWPGRSRALDAGRMPPLAGRLGSFRLGLWVSDQVPVAHRMVADGELEQAVEDQAPAAGRAPQGTP
jgi:hypothetical protein